MAVGVHGARVGPLQAELGEGLLVDAHHDDVVGRIALAPDREARVHGAVLEPVERARRVDHEAHGGAEHADRDDQGHPQASSARRTASDYVAAEHTARVTGATDGGARAS